MISDFSFTEQTETERGFAQVFHERVVPILKEREAEQLRRRRNLFVGGGGVALFGLVAGVLVGFSGGLAKGLAVGFVCLVVATAVAGYQQMRWRNKLGEQILPILAEFLGDMIYGREDLALYEFEERGVIPSFGDSEIEDAISGTHAGLKWAVAEVRLTSKTKTNPMSKIDNRGMNRTIFKGLLLKIEIFGPAPKMLLVPRGNSAADWLGELFSPKRRKGERFETGIPAFDAEMVSYSAEVEAARAYIDERFALGLVEMGRSGAKPVAAAMEGNWLYLAVPRRRDYLSFGSLWTPVREIEADLHRVIEELTLPRRIIDLLSGRQ